MSFKNIKIISNVDADTLDGKHASEFVPFSYIDTHFYPLLSTAITDINNGVWTNSTRNISNAKVKVSKSDNGRTLVTLLDNISESVQIDINKDIDLVLNGKKLSLTAQEAYLNFGENIDCSINGEIDGSEIKNTTSSSDTRLRNINSNANRLNIIGGKFSINGNTNMSVCIQLNKGNTVIKNSEIYVNNEFSDNPGSYGIAINTGANVQVNESIITVRAKKYLVIGIYCVDDGILEINNSTINSINSDSTTTGYSVGVYCVSKELAKKVVIKDSTIIADATGCNSNSSFSSGIRGVIDTLELYNSNIFGTHSGVAVEAKLYVNGGTYTGFCHGGFYFLHGEAGTAYINDATIRCGNYEGEFDYSGKTEDIYAAFYIGGGTNEIYSNTTVYLDNCTIDGTAGDNDFVMRGTDGETNNTVNISNSTCVKGKVRIDANLNHKLNVGIGNNITTDMITNNGADAEFTNELYRRNSNDKDLDGNDYNALLNKVDNMIDTNISLDNEVSGNLITINDSNPVITGFTIYGKSVQDGTPSPENPVPIVGAGEGGELDVTVCGANMAIASVTFNESSKGIVKSVEKGSNIIKIYGLATGSNGAICFKSEFLPAGTYTVSLDTIGNANRVEVRAIRKNGTQITQKTISAATLYCSISSDEFFCFYIVPIISTGTDMGTEQNPTVIHTSIVRGEETADFTSPMLSTATLVTGMPLYAVPVSSGGNVTINGQQYIADTLEVNADGTGEVTKRIIPHVVNFSNRPPADNGGNYRFVYNYSISELNIRRDVGYSDKFTLVPTNWENQEINAFYVYTREELVQIALFTEKNVTGESIGEVSFLLVSNNPYTIPLTAEEVQAVLSLQTFDSVTNIYNDGDTYQQIQYVTGILGDIYEIAKNSNNNAAYIGENNNWFEYDSSIGSFVDTGVSAQGIKGDAPIKGTDYWTDTELETIKAEIVQDVLIALPSSEEVRY